MNISNETLKLFLNIDKNKDYLPLINQHITESSYFSLPKPVNNLVVGKVLSCINHPDSDHLHILKVDVKNEILDIVCGASNIAKDQLVIVAKVGAKLPEIEIKQAKVRGVISNGMICSLKELGFEKIPVKYQEGIFVFENPKEVKIGEDANKYLGLLDKVYFLDLTTNRSDLLSYRGFSYDLASVLNKKVVYPSFEYNFSKEYNKKFELVVLSNKLISYNLTLAKVKIKQSPLFIQNELIKNNIKVQNNLIDISNYVMLLFGTPNHIFDIKTFVNNQVIIKEVASNLKVKALDENEYELIKNDLVISNLNNPTAIAGVMGLDNSKVLSDTEEVVIEFANFDPNSIYKTFKRLDLKTDSADRFSKGIDENIIDYANEYLLYLLYKYADAKISKHQIKYINKELVKKPLTIKLSVKQLSKVIGQDFKPRFVFNIFERLNFKPKLLKDNDTIKVLVPSYKKDILIKEDLYEEFLRVVGYNNIVPKTFKSDLVANTTNEYKISLNLRKKLANLGLNETITYSLIHNKDVYKYNNFGNILEVTHPITEYHKALRQSIVNGLVETYLYNSNRKITNINLFEIGHVFTDKFEKNNLAVLLSSKLIYNVWQKDSTKIDFFYAKGVLEQVLNTLDINEYKLVESNISSLHPKRQANVLVNEKVVGFIGQVLELKNEDVYVFELFLDELDTNNIRKVKYEKNSKYPRVERDIAFLVDKDIDIDKINFIIKQTSRKFLKKLELFDIYEDEKFENKVSLAYHLVLEDTLKQMDIKDVEKIINSIFNRLKFEFKAEIR